MMWQEEHHSDVCKGMFGDVQLQASRDDTRSQSREVQERGEGAGFGGDARGGDGRKNSSSHLFPALIFTSIPHVQGNARRSPVRPQCRAPTSPEAPRQPRRPMRRHPTATKRAEPFRSGRTGQKERRSGRRLHSLQDMASDGEVGRSPAVRVRVIPHAPPLPPAPHLKDASTLTSPRGRPPRQCGQPVTLVTASAPAPALFESIMAPPVAISSPPAPTPLIVAGLLSRNLAGSLTHTHTHFAANLREDSSQAAARLLIRLAQSIMSWHYAM